MNKLINIYCTNLDILYVYNKDAYGGIEFNISFTPEFTETFNWIKKYRLELEYEAELRKNNPSLSSQYEQYLTMLKLVKD